MRWRGSVAVGCDDVNNEQKNGARVKGKNTHKRETETEQQTEMKMTE